MDIKFYLLFIIYFFFNDIDKLPLPKALEPIVTKLLVSRLVSPRGRDSSSGKFVAQILIILIL